MSSTPEFKTGHIGINVTDIQRSIDFYTAVFGFEIVAKNTEGDKKFAFLGRNGELIVTLWQQANQGFDSARAGLHHLSFQVENAEAVAEYETRLRNNEVKLAYDGVVPHAEGASSGGLFFFDPDGTRLEIFAPAVEAAHAAPHGAAPSCGFF